MDTALTRKATKLEAEGWTITSLTPEALTATRRKGLNGLLMHMGIVGMLAAHAARGPLTITVTAAQAEEAEANAGGV